MKKLYLLILLMFFSISPVFANSEGDKVYGLIVLILLSAPYCAFSFLIFLLQRFSRKMENALSILIYILCLGGIVIAFFHAAGGIVFTFYAFNIFFLVWSLPFFIIIILEIISTRNQSAIRERKQEEIE